MRTKLTEEFIRSRPFGSSPIRDTEVKGLMFLCHKQTKSFAVQGDIWRNRRKVKCVKLTLGRTDRISLRVARSQAREFMAALSRGEDPTAPKASAELTLSHVWDLYKKNDRLSLKTKNEYAGHLRRYLKPWLRVPLSELGADRRAVREHHEQLTAHHGPYAANHAMRTFRALYNRALREDPSLPANPTVAVMFNKETKRNWAMAKEDLPHWWTKVERLNPLFRDLHLFLLFTGLRRTDACTARWEHWDRVNGTLFIPNPKGGADRGFLLPLSIFLNQLLCTRYQENEVLFPNSPWVFPSRSTSGHVEEPKKPGLPSPHAYRHTFRTLSLEAAIPYTEVCLLLNHKLQNVSYGYISRSAVITHLKQQQEKMTAYLLQAMHHENSLTANGTNHTYDVPELVEQSLPFTVSNDLRA